MKTTSYTLMDKLNELYDVGRFKEVMNELRHYLGALPHHARSPLVLGLLDLFKKVIDKDMDGLESNLDILERLFDVPGLGVQVEILDIIVKVSTIHDVQQKLFDR